MKIFSKIIAKKSIILVLSLVLPILSWVLFNKITNTNAQGHVDLYFSPSEISLPPDTSLDLILNAYSEPVAFVRVEINFDPTLVQLTSDVTTSPLFANVIEKTDYNEANITGKILLVLGLSTNDTDNPPTGIINLSQMYLTLNTQNQNQTGLLSINDIETQIVDINAVELISSNQDATIYLNTVTPTPVAEPSLTPTSTPLPTPTNTPSPYASLSFNLNQTAYINTEIPIDIYLSTDIPLSGVDAFINFNPSQLSLLRIEDKKLLTESTQILTDQSSGTIKISQLQPPQSGFTGEGVLATLIMLSASTGSKTLSFDYTLGSKADSNAIELASGNDVLAQPQSLSFNVIEHALLELTLSTYSENQSIGHSVSGNLYISDNSWANEFTTDSTGKDTIDLPDSFINNSRELIAKVNGYLRKRFNLQINSGLNIYTLGRLVAGDLNDDGIVNNIDLSLMYDEWFKQGTADFNKDGIVNSADHWILTNNFLKQDE